MKNNESIRELILLTIKVRMSFRQTLQRVLKQNNVDMTFEMLQIMNSLWDEEGVSQQILAEKTARDKACLTNLMLNLERKGWVLRREDPADRRNRLVYLTPEGGQMKNRVWPLIEDVYFRAGLRMNPEDVSQSINQLKKLDEIFNQL